MRKLLCVAGATIALAACGGGGGSTASITPVQGSGGRAAASISFTVPVATQQVANVGRAPQLAAGSAVKFSLSEDGALLFNGAALQPGTYTDPNSAATATVSAGSGAAFYTVAATIPSAAGAHDFAVIVSSTDGTVVGSAQRTISIAAGSTSAAALALGGGVASGYIECATLGQITAGNDCANYANFDTNAALYTFTAVAADASGYPIATQLANGAPVAFSNGAYTVIESPGDNPPIVSVSGGPWSNPGTAFAAPAGAYGNQFNVRCMRTGIAQLQMQLVGGAVLPAGAHSPGSVSVNCTASGSLTIL